MFATFYLQHILGTDVNLCIAKGRQTTLKSPFIAHPSAYLFQQEEVVLRSHFFHLQPHGFQMRLSLFEVEDQKIAGGEHRVSRVVEVGRAPFLRILYFRPY